jgi:hypothetical protein
MSWIRAGYDDEKKKNGECIGATVMAHSMTAAHDLSKTASVGDNNDSS